MCQVVMEIIQIKVLLQQLRGDNLLDEWIADNHCLGWNLPHNRTLEIIRTSFYRIIAAANTFSNLMSIFFVCMCMYV